MKQNEDIFKSCVRALTLYIILFLLSKLQLSNTSKDFTLWFILIMQSYLYVYTQLQFQEM